MIRQCLAWLQDYCCIVALPAIIESILLFQAQFPNIGAACVWVRIEMTATSVMQETLKIKRGHLSLGSSARILPPDQLRTWNSLLFLRLTYIKLFKCLQSAISFAAAVCHKNSLWFSYLPYLSKLSSTISLAWIKIFFCSMINHPAPVEYQEREKFDPHTSILSATSGSSFQASPVRRNLRSSSTL